MHSLAHIAFDLVVHSTVIRMEPTLLRTLFREESARIYSIIMQRWVSCVMPLLTNSAPLPSDIVEIRRLLEEATDKSDTSQLSSILGALELRTEAEARVLCSHYKGIECMIRSDTAGAVNYLTEALALYREQQNTEGAIAIQLNLCGCYAMLSETEQSYLHAHQALVQAESSNNTDLLARSLQNVGSVYNALANYSKGLEYLRRCESVVAAEENNYVLAGLLSNIGVTYFNLKEYDSAASYLQRSLAIAQATDVPDVQAFCNHYLGQVALATANFTNAQLYLEKALAYGIKNANVYSIAHNRLGLANVHVAANNLHEADVQLEVLHNVPDLPAELGARIETTTAKVLQAKGDMQGAKERYRNALLLAQAAKDIKQSYQITASLREIAKSERHFDHYVQYNELCLELLDAVQDSQNVSRVIIEEKDREIQAERMETEKKKAILYSVFPPHIAERVARGDSVNDYYAYAVVIFVDVVGFTTLSNSTDSKEVVSMLEELFSEFDAICIKYGIVKIKTIGDAYLAVAFSDDSTRHTDVENGADSLNETLLPKSVLSRATLASLEMVQVLPNSKDVRMNKLHVRIGMHAGPVTAGIIGRDRLQYDVWGDTVNIASRLEHTGTQDSVHVTKETAYSIAELGSNSTKPTVESRGITSIKGIGPIETYLLR